MKRSATAGASPGVLAFDLDGTLLDASGSPAPDVVEALGELHAAGILLVPCTGRPLHSALTAAATLGVSPAACVAYHGALVTDAVTGRWLRHLSLPRAATTDLVRRALEGGLLVSLYVGDERVDLEPGDAPTPLGGSPGVTRIVLSGAASQATPSSPLLAGARDAGLRLEPVRPGIVVVLPGGADKGEGLRLVVGHLRADPARTVACGDTTGDVSLLRAAACGIAVGDAPAELLEVADLTVTQQQLAATLRSVFARLR